MWFTASQHARYLMSRQEQVGIGFDVEYGKKLLVQIEQMMKEIADVVEPQLPLRNLKESEKARYKFPKRSYNNKGEPTEFLVNFLAKHQLELSPDNTVNFNGMVVKAVGDTYLPIQLPMKLGEVDDLKEWLLSRGWSPTLWNFKKDKRNKPIRGEDGKYIKTSPKIQEQGRICPNLLALDGELPRLVVRWFSLRNRGAVLRGWLDNGQLLVNERLPSGSSGITPTHRQKHTCVANIPKAEEGVLLGKEFRSLFVAKDGNVLVGYDAAALEARVTGHYTHKYDGGEYARELLEGDIHTKNAWIFFREALELVGCPKDASKDHHLFKPFRSKAKNCAYCLSYGGSAGKLAETAGVPQSRGKDLYDRYWESNWALAKLKENVIAYWKKHGKLIGIDGRPLFGRSPHSLVNLLFQSCGAIAMDYANAYMDNWITELGIPAKRVAYYHDESLWECPEEYAQQVGELGVKSIVEAGELLKLNIPLAAEWKYGKSWRDTH